jgi:hypothetical protein
MGRSAFKLHTVGARSAEQHHILLHAIDDADVLEDQIVETVVEARQIEVIELLRGLEPDLILVGSLRLDVLQGGGIAAQIVELGHQGAVVGAQEAVELMVKA